MRKKHLLYLFLTLLSIGLKAQNIPDATYDTARREDPRSATPSQVHRLFKFNERYDSTLLNFHQYDNILRNGFGVQNLGDIGTPYLLQIFNPYIHSGFRPHSADFSLLTYTRETDLHYNSKIPFTTFYYSQGNAGQRGLIHFEALHTQNIGENFNLSVKYRSTSYDGFYLNQSLYVKNLGANMYYRTTNHKYLVSAYFHWNKLFRLENGGMVSSEYNDSLFRTLRGNNRLVDVNMRNASNLMRMSDFSFTHSLRLDNRADSLGHLVLSHTFENKRSSAYYRDESSDYPFYDSIYHFESQNSADSFITKSLRNRLEVYNTQNEKLGFRAGADYTSFYYYNAANAGNYILLRSDNTSVFSEFDFNIKEKFKSRAFAEVFATGYNAGDRQFNFSSSLKSGRNLLEAELINFSRKPAYRDRQYISNHYIWENTSIQDLQVSGIRVRLNRKAKNSGQEKAFRYSSPKQSLSVEWAYNLIDHYIYYDSTAIPSQLGAGQSHSSIKLNWHLNLRKFHFDQKIGFQQFSNTLKEKIQLPSWTSASSIYFQTYAFKKATFVQIGLSGRIAESYTSRIYNPATLQYQVSRFKTGGYPFIDFFMNAEIKTARIFFVMEHLNMDIPDAYTFSNYLYTTPGYPASPRRFRLGFSWKFYY